MALSKPKIGRKFQRPRTSGSFLGGLLQITISGHWHSDFQYDRVGMSGDLTTLSRDNNLNVNTTGKKPVLISVLISYNNL